MLMKKISLFFLSFILAAFIIPSIYAQTPTQIAPQIKVLFSPQDNCAQEIVSEIDKAKDYVYVAMYYFTSRPIAQALIRARDRGVDVKVCLDEEQPTYEYSKSRFLENKGINMKLIGGSGIMHNKFCIIDDHITLTGSCNWTVSA
ncbi:phospholipase D family protein, partial [bacterium]|nr:phospholipase D family protein [bacterium]